VCPLFAEVLEGREGWSLNHEMLAPFQGMRQTFPFRLPVYFRFFLEAVKRGCCPPRGMEGLFPFPWRNISFLSIAFPPLFSFRMGSCPFLKECRSCCFLPLFNAMKPPPCARAPFFSLFFSIVRPSFSLKKRPFSPFRRSHIRPPLFFVKRHFFLFYFLPSVPRAGSEGSPFHCVIWAPPRYAGTIPFLFKAFFFSSPTENKKKLSLQLILSSFIEPIWTYFFPPLFPPTFFRFALLSQYLGWRIMGWRRPTRPLFHPSFQEGCLLFFSLCNDYLSPFSRRSGKSLILPPFPLIVC